MKLEDVAITGGVMEASGANGTAEIGGGVYITAGQVTMSSVAVSHNQVKGGNGRKGISATPAVTAGRYNGGPGGNAQGGGIYMANGALNLVNTNVSDNQATGGYGGAGGNGKTGRGVFEYEGEAGGLGGTGGSADGGGVYVAGGKIAVENSVVSHNSVKGGSGGTGGNGGTYGGTAGARRCRRQRCWRRIVWRQQNRRH